MGRSWHLQARQQWSAKLHSLVFYLPCVQLFGEMLSWYWNEKGGVWCDFDVGTTLALNETVAITTSSTYWDVGFHSCVASSVKPLCWRNDWNPGTWVLIWRYSLWAIQWIPSWEGLSGFQQSLHSCIKDKVVLALELLTELYLKAEVMSGPQKCIIIKP